MNNSLDKPLPTIPKQQDNSLRITTTLSVEARDHLRRFILHALEESANLARDDWETEKLSWTSGLLDALDTMGESMGTGGWLTGVRRARKTRTMRKMGDSSRKVKTLSDETDLEVEEGSSSNSSEPSVASSKEAIKQLRRTLSKSTVLTPKPSSKHFLLTVAAFGAKITIPNEDTEFDLIPSDIGCRFSSNFFLLPPSGDDIAGVNTEEGIVLYGLDEWDVYTGETEVELLKIVGGTFSFNGVTSAAHHISLCKVLRLAIYVYLSLILEQHLLSDSHVKLNLPKRRSPRPLPHAPVVNDVRPRPSLDSGTNSKKPSGIWSFVSKRTESLLQRATTFGARSEAAPRRVSSDHKGDSVIRQDPSLSPQSSHQRTRTFTFLPGATKFPKEIDVLETIPPYRATIRRIERSRELLSTSPGLTFPLPSLLASLAEKEDRDPSRRLTAAEKHGLNNVLGWEGRETRGKGMAGIQGFVRHQDICVLYSEHVLPRAGRPVSVVITSDTASTSSTISSATTVETTTAQASIQCGGRARWMCFQYYSRKNRDKTLGEAITQICSVAEDPCGHNGCQSKRRDHELRFIHGRVRIVVNVTSLEIPIDDDYIEMWESCRECGEKTKGSKMSDGTFLLSFGKYLELLIYSPALHVLHPPLCEHTNIPTDSTDPPSKASSFGFNIYRHFSYRTHRITFSLSAIEDVFEVHVPKLQLVKPSAHSSSDGAITISSSMTGQSNGQPSVAQDTSKKDLRKEIMTWWQGISEYMDRLEQVFIQTDDLKTLLKSLPRLPSSDDAYEDYGICDPDATPKPSISSLPSVKRSENTASTTSPPVIEPSPEDKLESDSSSMSSSIDSLPPTPQNIDNVQLLSNIRHDFQREEQNLYAQLSQSPLTCLNNVRRSFITTARGATKRLSAWEKKHLPKGVSLAESLSAFEPTWWDSGCHAVPGGNVIVREGDWGSIIAFTLSSQDFLKELAAMSSGKPSNPSLLSSATISSTETRPSMFSKNSYRIFTSSRPPPDPDDGQVVWHDDEICSAVISRKDHPRDPSALLSLRDVLRKAPGDVGNTISSLRLAVPTRGSTPPSAWAKPAVEINTLAVVGQIDTPEQEGLVGKMLQEMDSTLDTTSSHITTSGSSIYAPSTSSMSIESHIRRGEASSLLSASESSDSTVTPSDIQESVIVPPPSSSKDTEHAATASTAGESSSFMSASLTGSIAHVMRYMLHSGEQHTPSPARSNNTHHGLLSLESPAIDERPHIKYDWTIGKRLKFSCTVYYAKQFDTLRRRCGIEDVFLKSMEKSDNWIAEGGKSKSNFWKTSDNRFIIKTLVNAWNVADLHVLMELGPSYFRYMDSTAGKPSVLAKLLGSYTVEIRNLETGTTLAKSDLVVMENLFFDKKIDKTFDLKGIQGRKVKAKSHSTGSRTLFDGEWIEGQQRALTLLHPYSKLVLQEAIKSDCDYLSKSNIMDYSLLLGIDVERKQIACGLVDTIGSYTFAKTLEYKAKHNLKAGKEVTVIPPNEYQERFVSAMDNYFLACPDKWSKPFDNTKINSDPNLLPSVL